MSHISVTNDILSQLQTNVNTFLTYSSFIALRAKATVAQPPREAPQAWFMTIEGSRSVHSIVLRMERGTVLSSILPTFLLFLPHLRLITHIGHRIHRDERLRILPIDKIHQLLVFVFLNNIYIYSKMLILRCFSLSIF